MNYPQYPLLSGALDSECKPWLFKASLLYKIFVEDSISLTVLTKLNVVIFFAEKLHEVFSLQELPIFFVKK